MAILYVSHHLDEVFEIADEVSVLRDGRRVTTERVDTLDHDRLIELMIGHKIVQGRSGAGAAGDEVLLDVRGLQGANIHGVDLQVRAGEVVGVAGITGSGRENLVPLLTGQAPSNDGSVEINGRFVGNYAPNEVLERWRIRHRRPQGPRRVRPDVGHRQHDDLRRRSQRTTRTP